MTGKAKDRFYNAAISIAVAMSGVIIAASLTADAASKHDVELQLRDKATKVYVDEQNKRQDDTIEMRLRERDKVNAMILEELKYIRERVDLIPTNK